ncbi:MAG: glucose-6-phosphate dehydrogenase [Parachlamydiaceae bacterium]|nr:glucose-6-phosphate dehydrogenase [Parachlamydiaceae bacterium]
MSSQLEPTIFVIFGGGDLTWRKLIPSLFDLNQDREAFQHFEIIIIDIVALDDKSLCNHLHKGVVKFSKNKVNLENWNNFSKHIHYLQGDFQQLKTYKSLSLKCKNFEDARESKFNYIFYMATPPSLFEIIPAYLKKSGLSQDKQRSRLVVEKPIGHDLDSAKKLNLILLECFDESQIFRIDHYLGKETVQNILAFRFANPFFEPIWDRRYVNYVTITVAEEVGVEHRGVYYEHAGALRDMIQNHLMQLLCLVAMEPMGSFDANEIRSKKVDVIHAIRPITHAMVHAHVIRGQYNEGWIEGKKVPGYREEHGVSPHSETETFVAMKLLIDNWRWQDVPFYLRTGKRLTQSYSEIAIHFKSVPHQLFPPEATLDWHPANLIIAIQPNEEIILRFQAKHPGPDMHLKNVEMQFNYEKAFDTKSPEAYETLLWDVIKNDPTLFMRQDQVEASWQLFMPILEMWAESPPSDFPNYAAGTMGPEPSNWLLAQQGHCWPLSSQSKK